MKIHQSLSLTDRIILNPPKRTKTINNEDSLLVTDATTNSSACGLSTAERTGSPVLRILWSIVVEYLQLNNISPLLLT